MQDSSNACNLNADVGYTSWSLVCHDTDHKKTTCSVLLKSMEPKFTDICWKKSAKYVTVDERVISNFDPIIEKAEEYLFVAVNDDISKFSEIKDGGQNKHPWAINVVTTKNDF